MSRGARLCVVLTVFFVVAPVGLTQSATGAPNAASSAAPGLAPVSAALAPQADELAKLPRGSGMARVSAGGEYSCGVRTDHTLWCWGRNTYGQLGLGSKGTGPVAPKQVGSRATWRGLSAGGATTCGTQSNGSLWCWGLNHRGQVGDGTRDVRLTPRKIAKTNLWKQVSAGWFHTCATRTNGSLFCWGDNSAGQLGRGDTKARNGRVKVPGNNWASVAVGGWTTCAVKRDRTLWCWGRNTFGQLGSGSWADSSRPKRVGSSGLRWRQVSVSWTHACGVTRGGDAMCWGRNNQGQLGDGTTAASNLPRAVRRGAGTRSVTASEGTSCLITGSGTLRCWGDNRYGQVRPKGPAVVWTPRSRSGTFANASGGWLHNCAVRSDGGWGCRGSNEWGQLGFVPSRSARTQVSSAASPTAARRGPANFTLATMNVLGNNHTAPYRHDDRFGPSRMRAEWAAQALVTRGIDVVSLQEASAGQLASILAASGGRYEAFPGPSAGDLGVETTMLWDKTQWEATRRATITTQFIRRKLKRPVVRLKHIATGRQIWVMGVHNAPWDYQTKRNQAVRVQLEKLQELEATGLPVFYVGDMNEKMTILCKVLRATDMVSPIGGKITSEGECVKPRQTMRVDWIFGSKTVGWSRFENSRAPLVRLSTDHWVPVVDVQLP